MGYFFASRQSSGVDLKAISSKSDSSLERAKEVLGEKSKGIVFTKDNIKAALSVNCVLICTPDDIIEDVCEDIVRGIGKKDLNNYCFVHFSGSKSMRVLGSAKNAGAGIVSIHPIKSFASVDEAIKTLKDTFYGVTCSNRRSGEIAGLLVKILGGKTIEVADDKKPLYHAASCVASNYLVALLNYAAEINKRIGMKQEDSIKVLASLVEGTVKNINKMGIKKSLTGPIARGDTGTIEEHMKGFRKIFTEEEIRLYKLMGIETGKIAYRNKWIKYRTLEKLKEILEG